nr:hypothetical protein [Lachnospiraceae bacterium]
EATPYILPTGNFYIHFDGESNSFWNHYTLSGGKVSFESYIDVDYDEIGFAHYIPTYITYGQMKALLSDF